MTAEMAQPFIVTPQDVQAARLLKRLNDADGLETDQATLAIANAVPMAEQPVSLNHAAGPSLLSESAKAFGQGGQNFSALVVKTSDGHYEAQIVGLDGPQSTEDRAHADLGTRPADPAAEDEPKATPRRRLRSSVNGRFTPNTALRANAFKTASARARKFVAGKSYGPKPR